MAISEKAKVSVELDSGQAENRLKKLSDEAANWRSAMADALAAGDVKKYASAEKGLKETQKNMREVKKECFDLAQVMNNLSGAKAPELRKAAQRLNAELKKPHIKRGSAEWKRYTEQLRQVQGEQRRLRDEISGTNDQVSRSGSVWSKFKGHVGSLLPMLSIAAVGTAIASLGKDLFELSKTIQGESIRSATVLGDELGYVESQAEKVAAKMGVTNREFVSMVANTGDLLIPLDFTRKKSAEMATEVQNLAGALDEWTAGKYGVAEVSNILTKAMLGEMEQLKGLGIAIRQDSTEFRNLVKEKEKGEAATKAQARALATLELLYKKSADAQTAYAKSGNQILRWQKSVSRWWKQLKVDVADYMAYSKSERLLRRVKDMERVEQQMAKEDKQLKRLVSTYERLKVKEKLTTDEQKLLNGAIKEIGQIVPGAITEFDSYGNAIDISVTRINQLREAQRLMQLETKKGLTGELVAAAKQDLQFLDQAVLTMGASQKLLTKTLSRESLPQAGQGLIRKWFTPDSKGIAEDIDSLNNLMAQKNEELAQTFLKLKDIGLTDEEIMARLSITAEKMNGVIDEYMKRHSVKSEDVEEKQKSLFKALEDQLKLAKQMPETTKEEIAARNRKIESINKEIKSLKELGTAKSHDLKLSDFLKKTDEEQRDFINGYFANVGEEAFDSFISAIEKSVKMKEDMGLGIDLSVLDEDENEEEDKDSAFNYTINKYQQTLEFKEALLNAQRERGLIGEEEYQDKLKKIEESKLKVRQKNREKYERNVRDITRLGANFVTSMMEYELSAAGDNEKKKKEIRKKYALSQFAISASNIIVDTASAVMKGYSQLGPIGGAIAQAIVMATGGVQLGIAYKQMQQVNGKKDGGFTGWSNSNDDVMGVYHANEWYSNADTTKKMRPMFEVLDQHQKAGTIETLNIGAILSAMNSNSVRSSSNNGSTGAVVEYETPVAIENGDLVAVLGRVSDVLGRLERDGVSAEVALTGRRGLIKQQERYDGLRREAGFK